MLAHSSGNPCSCMFSMGKLGGQNENIWRNLKKQELFGFQTLYWVASMPKPRISGLYGTAWRPEIHSIPEPCGVQDEETNRRKMLATAIGRKDPTVPPCFFLKWTWRACSHACGIVITETNAKPNHGSHPKQQAGDGKLRYRTNCHIRPERPDGWRQSVWGPSSQGFHCFKFWGKCETRSSRFQRRCQKNK